MAASWLVLVGAAQTGAQPTAQTILPAKPLDGFTTADASRQFALEARFDGYLDAARLGSRLKIMSSHPHHVGSPGDQAVAAYIYDQFKSFGFQVTVDTFYVLFPTPKTRELELIAPTHYKALLAERAVKGDSTSGQADEQLPSYNAWSADGDVTGELIVHFRTKRL